MNIEALIKMWFEYFGEEDSPLVKKVLESWIACEFRKGSVSNETAFLKHLNAVVIEHCSRQYRRVPGVAELDKLRFEVWTRYNDELQRTSTAKQIPELYMSSGEIGDIVEKMAEKLRYKEVDKNGL